MNPVRRAALIAVAAVLPLAAACGPSCETVCEKKIQCQAAGTAGIISDTLDSCIADCEAGLCATEEKSDAAAECYAQMTCSTVTGSWNELGACSSRCD